MNDMRDYLKKRAGELGLERGGQLAKIQEYLDELYPGMCRAVSLNDGVLKIAVTNSSVASELRHRTFDGARTRYGGPTSARWPKGVAQIHSHTRLVFSRHPVSSTLRICWRCT